MWANNSKTFYRSKDFLKHLTDIKDVYPNLDNYHQNRICEILILFDDMIAYMLSNEKLEPIVAELFFCG